MAWVQHKLFVFLIQIGSRQERTRKTGKTDNCFTPAGPKSLRVIARVCNKTAFVGSSDRSKIVKLQRLAVTRLLYKTAIYGCGSRASQRCA
jgi:hypothetical protein